MNEKVKCKFNEDTLKLYIQEYLNTTLDYEIVGKNKLIITTDIDIYNEYKKNPNVIELLNPTIFRIISCHEHVCDFPFYILRIHLEE